MNLMMAASGYPWVVIPLAERGAYMARTLGRSQICLRVLWKNAWRASRFRVFRRSQSEAIVTLQHARTHTSALRSECPCTILTS
jgi:hypothetical protein